MAKKGEKEEELITIKKIVKTRSKKSTRKNPKKNASSAPKKNENIEKILIQNFVSLQEVMTDLSFKFDGLSKNISRLLELFEKSATALMEKDLSVNDSKKEEQQGKDIKEVVEGLNRLLEQNKTLARGLVLLHESNPAYRPQQVAQMPQQLPPVTQFRPMPPENAPVQKESEPGNYQKSISSENKNA
ncbi:MAG TPA: hypothetical protein PLK34_01140 [Candidatus Pacearchaeota archaeon]|nr:hypothetical protein [Candidatus Pacearchaeota archaeon]